MKFKGSGRIKELCKWAAVAKSSFYYKPQLGQRGARASTHTPIGDGLVENELVVEQIRAILCLDYCVYGYQIMTRELREMGYVINKKKVYRLMKESHLLWGKRIQAQGKRTWVRHRRIEAQKPMEYLCLDIKYIWVQGENRWYYQLGVMDVYSRRILCWIFQRSIRQTDVVAIMRNLDLRFGLKGVVIRNDNGSQFIAHKVREALQELEARQEFTHVATPEENAYIEAFHSIQQRELIDRFSFASYYEAKQHIEKYMHWYNRVRRHGALIGLTPMQKWEQGWAWLTVKQIFDSASMVLSRPDREGFRKGSAPYSLDQTSETGYLSLTGNQTKEFQEVEPSVANSFRKSVQFIRG